MAYRKSEYILLIAGAAVVGYAAIPAEPEQTGGVPEAKTFGAQLEQEMATNYRYQPRLILPSNQIIIQDHCRYLLANPKPMDTEFERWYQVGSHQWISLPVNILTQLCRKDSQ